MSGRGGNPINALTPAQRRKASMDRRAKEEKESGRRATPAGVAGAMLAITPIGMAKPLLFPANVAKSLLNKGAAKVASTAAAKAATKAPKALVSKLKKVKNPVKGFDPNKPFVMVKGKATNKIPPSKVSKIAKATPDKPMSRPEKIARVAAGQGKPTNVRTGTSARNPGLNLQSKKTGKLSGVKNKDARIGMGVRDMAGTAGRAAGVVAASAAAGGKKPTSNIVDVKKKPAPPKAEAKPAPTKPAQKTPKPAEKVSSGGRGKSKGSMGGETIGEYSKDLSQRNTKVKTPFGLIDVDSTDEGMAFEEFDQKYGGKVMTRKKGGKAKPRRRAALRGHRAEQRGG